MKLYPHQQRTLDETVGFSNIGIFHDMGLGKTFTGSEAMLRFNTNINLIICQKSKIQDWVDHFKEQYGFTEVFDLTKPKELQDFFLHVGYYNMIGIINYELAWRRKRLLQLSDFTLMLDESSLIQNPKAKQTKFILKLTPAHVILLSGTPVGGKYENLWSQCKLLGWKITEHAFENTYVNWTKIETCGFFTKIVDKEDPYKNVDRLKSKLREHGAVFLKTEEVMDLPDQVFQKILVDKSTEYKKFRKNHIIQIKTIKPYCEYTPDSDFYGEDVTPVVELTGDTTLTKLLYSRQLCGQYSLKKIEAVRDLIHSTQDRLIIFYNFDAELEVLKKICKDRPISEINGHDKDLVAYEQESNSITLVQYQAGSKGLNLQKCNRIIYFTLPLSSEHFEQSKKRIHRIGQEKPCFYYLPIVRNSIEEHILETLEQRKDYTDELFEELDS